LINELAGESPSFYKWPRKAELAFLQVVVMMMVVVRMIMVVVSAVMATTILIWTMMRP
jgi:hypothetical protein